MRVQLRDDILLIHHEDVPAYKKNGSVVRNSYFWALKSIAAQAHREKDWEFEVEVWFALQRMLLSFAESGYLGLRETCLEFSPTNGEIPAILRPISTWQDD